MADKERQKALEERSTSLRATVCEQLAEDIESMGAKWVREWMPPAGLPRNPVTGTVYKGGNVAFLLCAARQKGYSDPRWCTFNNAKSKGWHVRKGEKGCHIEHWKSITFDDGLDPEETDRTGHMKTYTKLYSIATVFNFEQIEGVPELEIPESVGDYEVCRIADALIESSRCPVHEIPSQEAYYSPGSDAVVIPMREQFSRPEAFIATLFHEMGHSTGPELGREQSAFFVDPKAYSKEEMIAELSSVFSSAELGIGGDYAEGLDTSTPEYSNHIAYLKHYASILREDPNILFKCTSKAKEATDVILARYEEQAAQRGLPTPISSKIAAPDKPHKQIAENKGKSSLAQKFARAKEASEKMEAQRAIAKTHSDRHAR